MEITLRDGVSVRHGERIQYMGLAIETRQRELCVTWCEGKKFYHENMNGIDTLPSGPAAKKLQAAAAKLEPFILAYLTEPTHDGWWGIKQSIQAINGEV